MGAHACCTRHGRTNEGLAVVGVTLGARGTVNQGQSLAVSASVRAYFCQSLLLPVLFEVEVAGRAAAVLAQATCLELGGGVFDHLRVAAE